MKITGSNRTRILAGAWLLWVLVLVALIFSLSRRRSELPPTSAPTSGITDSILTARTPAAPTREPGPGVIINGYVHDQSGTALEGVEIYRSYASYPGVLIATSDATGYYTSKYYSIPGDEMIAVWAEKSTLVFEPAYCNWRHYYGFEKRECNFQASAP